MKVSPLPVLLFAWFVFGISTVEAQQRLTPEPAPRARFLVEPTVEGVIKIGTPQVYSRQLVFRDRAEEIQYLSERLKKAKDFPTTFQGIVDSRFYKALGLQMALAVDPLTGRVADQGKINQALNLEQQVQVNEVENEIKVLDALRRKAEAQKLLDEAKKPVVPPKEGEEEEDDAPPPNPILPSPAVDGQARTDIAALQTQIDALKNAGPAPVTAEANRVKPAATNEPRVLKEGGKAAETTEASLTPIENEKAVLEVRRFLQNERRRLSFDDMHDSAGTVAVDLGMLVTMIPPKGKDAYAVVEAFVEDVAVENCADYQQIVRVWSDHLLSAMQLEKEFLEQRMASNALPLGEKYFQLAVQELQRVALQQNITDEARKVTVAADAQAAAKIEADKAAKAKADAEANEVGTKKVSEETQRKADVAKDTMKKADDAKKPKPGVQQAPGVVQQLEKAFDEAKDAALKASLEAERTNLMYLGAVKARSFAEQKVIQAQQKLVEEERKLTEAERNQAEAEDQSLTWQSKAVQLQSSHSSVGTFARILEKENAEANLLGSMGATSATPEADKKPSLLEELILTLIPLEEQKAEQEKGELHYARMMRKYNERLLNTYLQLYFGNSLPGITSALGSATGDFLSLLAKKDVVRSAAETFLRQLSSDASKSRVRVLAVDPADQGQNISNVGATQSISDIVLSLSAMMPNGISGKGRMDSYRDSQLFLQSANRKPIAVGFVNGDAKDPSFGWVLGPRFEVALKRRWYQLGMGEPRATPTFTHEPTQHQVQVSIGMAAWTPELRLKLCTRWLDKKTGLPATPLQSSYTVPVRMTPDFTAMTEGMLDLIHGKRRPPRILIGASGEKFILSSQGDEHKLVLLGKDMWRSPMVYLDSLPATTVDVMPGLVGVVATFKGALPLKKAGKTDHDVTITTTDGFDVIYNRVESPKAPAAAAPSIGVSLRVDQPVVEHAFSANGEMKVRLKVVENRFPLPLPTFLKGEFFPLGVYSPATAVLAAGHNETLTLGVGAADKSVVQAVPNLVGDPAKDGAAKLGFTVRMPIVDPTTGVPDFKDVILGKHYVVVVDPTKNKYTHALTANLVPGDQPLEIPLQFPPKMPGDLFMEAYPELVSAAANKGVRLQLMKDAEGTQVFLECPMAYAEANVTNGLRFVLPKKSEAVGPNLLPPTAVGAAASQKITCHLRLVYGQKFHAVDKPLVVEIPVPPAPPAAPAASPP